MKRSRDNEKRCQVLFKIREHKGGRRGDRTGNRNRCGICGLRLRTTQESVDVLFIGGALYAYGIDEHLKAYLGSLKKDQVKKAVVFSTSWISKHAIDLIRGELNRKGIPVEKETLYFRGKPGEKQLQDAVNVARRICGQ